MWLRLRSSDLVLEHNSWPWNVAHGHCWQSQRKVIMVYSYVANHLDVGQIWDSSFVPICTMIYIIFQMYIQNKDKCIWKNEDLTLLAYMEKAISIFHMVLIGTLNFGLQLGQSDLVFSIQGPVPRYPEARLEVLRLDSYKMCPSLTDYWTDRQTADNKPLQNLNWAKGHRWAKGSRSLKPKSGADGVLP